MPRLEDLAIPDRVCPFDVKSSFKTSSANQFFFSYWFFNMNLKQMGGGYGGGYGGGGVSSTL